jgi:hypothetical protein
MGFLSLTLGDTLHILNISSLMNRRFAQTIAYLFIFLGSFAEQVLNFDEVQLINFPLWLLLGVSSKFLKSFSTVPRS